MNADGTSTQPLVLVEDVHTYYGKSHILNGVSLHVDPGEVVGLLGRNGVGKSTTLKTIMGLVQPSQGRVLLNGSVINGLPALGLTRPMMLLSVVLLPTPLRPIRPTTSPRPTSRETSLRIWLLP